MTIQLLLTTFMPHGACYLWKSGLVGLHLGSNAIIALSYFSIPISLVYLVQKRRDLPFNGLFFLFAAFIVACGLGHLMDIWTLWHPNYWTSGLVKLITAVVSWTTALVFIDLIPFILTLPSPSQLALEIEERTRVETALQASQKQLESIFNQTFQLMGLLNSDGTVVSLNQTALDLMKLTNEAVKNIPFQQLSGWQNSAALIERAIDSVVTSKESVQRELIFESINKTLVIFDFSFKPLLDELGNIQLIIAEGRDISQRKQAEAKLQQLNQELEERVNRRTKALEEANTKIKIYEDIVLSLPIGLTIWHLEDLDDIDSFRLIDINPMAINVLQLNREDYINQRMVDCFPNIWSDSHQRAVKMYAEVVRTQTNQSIDDLFYEDNRIGEFHFDVKAFPLPNQSLGIAFENITQRKQIEQALIKSTRRYRQVVNSVNEVIFKLDLQGNCIFLNPAWTKITGYEVIESLNHSCLNYIVDSVQKTEITRLFALLVNGELNTLQIDFPCKHIQGKSCWLEMKASLQPAEETETEMVVLGTLTDITFRKEAEIALQERASELSYLNALLLSVTNQLEKRNQELDQFAYVTSHDLKAPLRAIANLSEWIEEDLRDYLQESTLHHMTLLRGRVRRMENLINGLLEYSRADRFKYSAQSVDVALLLEEVIESLDPPDSFSILIIGQMPELITPKIPLQQVFSNLIGNALKHHPRSDGVIEISSQEQVNYYQFSVKDDGDGIDSRYHQKIFEIFQTLSPRDQKENTGIGLSIVKKIVENHGGKITLDSSVGHGAVFYFTWQKVFSLP
ncbi:ATP-binding protein [Gloeocapsa sp. PCC 73106]|uniref:ATP-binding protein n=1 Tax=Gloeocapsa sp. PCC 73106 TaxID=102232 RepID=UPI0002AC5493|nr:ATP-binding protein [Gloeocapsa sp. PCC 73106]ELR98117.1 PAS domain S-box [Gloeocapsa sp. PCC 73106]